jgi:hypothetical protein
MKIGIDFDGTITEHEYPAIGRPAPGAIEWMKKFKKDGNKLILWTMRDGKELQAAVDYCRENGVEFDSVNKGIGDRAWTQSPKAHCNVFIDDAAFGCPPKQGIDSQRPVADWSVIGPGVEKLYTFGQWAVSH